MSAMGSRERRAIIGGRRGREMTTTILRELHDGRLDRNLSGRTVGAALGISPAEYSRIERGLTRGITIEQAAVLLAAVGLDLSVRVYPGGHPIRDIAHTALLGRLRALAHPSIRVLTEVAFPARGDQRAWDLVAAGPSWRHAFEAETRPRDRQALERRIALKVRDGTVDGVSLLLSDSRHNREFVRANASALQDRFPVPGPMILERLRAGDDPGPGGVVLL